MDGASGAEPVCGFVVAETAFAPEPATYKVDDDLHTVSFGGLLVADQSGVEMGWNADGRFSKDAVAG